MRDTLEVLPPEVRVCGIRGFLALAREGHVPAPERLAADLAVLAQELPACWDLPGLRTYLLEEGHLTREGARQCAAVLAEENRVEEAAILLEYLHVRFPLQEPEEEIMAQLEPL